MGPTEGTTFSSCHVMERMEEVGEKVSIGRPISNTRIYIVDRKQELAPVGVIGEIGIGGEGLGRGYIGRAELTAEKFVPEGMSGEKGARMYRSGDRGRYLEDGRIEFFGREDGQVKIRGYRIEVGEIESALRLDGRVKEAVVVARGEGEGSEKKLVGYVVMEEEAENVAVELKEQLRRVLPEYMVPGQLVRLEKMPLTANGKVDRAKLPEPEAKSRGYAPAQSEKERVLAGIWEKALKVERVGVEDNFFELGGDSILSIQVIARALEAGLKIRAKDLFERPTIRELALRAEEQGARREGEEGMVEGPVELTPIQRWHLEWEPEREKQHFNQSVMLEVKGGVGSSEVEAVVGEILRQHDALRMRFRKAGGGWEQRVEGEEKQRVYGRVDVSGQGAEALEQIGEQLQRSLDLEKGPLVRALWVEGLAGGGRRLLWVIHHLVVDGVSWRILLEDFERGVEQQRRGQKIQLGRKSSSYRQWAQRLQEYSRSAELKEELEYWKGVEGKDREAPPVDGEGENWEWEEERLSVKLGREQTRELLQETPGKYRATIEEVMVGGLGMTLEEWQGGAGVRLELEGHGREDLGWGLELSRSVGWYTSIYPVDLEIGLGKRAGAAMGRVKETLRQRPKGGVGYGVLRYLSEEGRRALGREPSRISFNYLGQFDQMLESGGVFRVSGEGMGPSRSNAGKRRNWIEINSWVIGGELEVAWSYNRKLHRRETIQRLAERHLEKLRELTAESPDQNGTSYIPSDFRNMNFNQETLDQLLQKLDC